MWLYPSQTCTIISSRMHYRLALRYGFNCQRMRVWGDYFTRLIKCWNICSLFYTSCLMERVLVERWLMQDKVFHPCIPKITKLSFSLIFFGMHSYHLFLVSNFR